MKKTTISTKASLADDTAEIVSLQAEYYYRRRNRFYFRDKPGGQVIALEVDPAQVNKMLDNLPPRGEKVNIEFQTS